MGRNVLACQVATHLIPPAPFGDVGVRASGSEPHRGPGRRSFGSGTPSGMPRVALAWEVGRWLATLSTAAGTRPASADPATRPRCPSQLRLPRTASRSPPGSGFGQRQKVTPTTRIQLRLGQRGGSRRIPFCLLRQAPWTRRRNPTSACRDQASHLAPRHLLAGVLDAGGPTAVPSSGSFFGRTLREADGEDGRQRQEGRRTQ
jgi:hypothetical protein